MKLSSFDYKLDKELIAQKPVRPRDRSRLMVLDRKGKKISHYFFYELEKFLKSGDVLVLNDSKVIPARLYAKKSSGGKVEVFLLREIASSRWKVMTKGLKPKNGEQELFFSRQLSAKTKKFLGPGLWEIEFNLSGEKLEKIIKRLGEAPTPPYIKQKTDLRNYQTIFAKYPGSVAAPTAGFHFTKPLIRKLKKKGVKFEFITLHVGPGTFLPVKSENIKEHRMHSERASISLPVAKRLNKAKKEGRRIIAVGTTSTRVLESFSQKGKLGSGEKELDIFIYPGYKFKFIDGLITNFHLPKSTLLVLVSAFACPAGEKRLCGAGRDFILKAYREAIKNKYRFFSFGDAMFVT